MSGQFPFGFTPGSGGGEGGGSGGSGGSFGFGEGAPFFRELERLLSWQGGPVNWELARQVAVQASTGAADGDPDISTSDRSELREAGRLAELWLDAATTLPGVGVELDAWTRVQWVERTLPVWKGLCDPVASKVVDAMGTALTGGLSALPGMPELADQLPEGVDLNQLGALGGPLLGMLRQIGGLLFGAQVGGALGALSHEVLGATDVGLPLGPAALVSANLAEFGKGLEVPDDQVRLYLALRELAHQRLFAHVPWLKAHLLGAVEEYARGISIDTEAIGEAMGKLDPSMLNPSQLNPENLSELLGEDVFAQNRSPQQEAALARLETVLALVEGWVDEVVDAAARDRLTSAAALRETIRRRRATGGPAEQTFAALVGLELRPRRLREAAALWKALLDARGIDGRDDVWSHPDLLPGSADLDDPERYARGGSSEGVDPIAELERLAKAGGEAPKEELPSERNSDDQPRGEDEPPRGEDGEPPAPTG